MPLVLLLMAYPLPSPSGGGRGVPAGAAVPVRQQPQPERDGRLRQSVLPPPARLHEARRRLHRPTLSGGRALHDTPAGGALVG